MTDERLAELDAAVAHDTRGVMTLLYKNWPDLRAHIDAQAATIARQDEALRGIKSISIEAAEQAGMGLMDGSITPLQRAALRGEVKRCLALVDVCKAALTGAA